MKKLGIICAVHIEAKPYIDSLQNTIITKKASLEFKEGTLFGIPTVITDCGIGKTNVAAAVQQLIDIFSVDTVIMSGTAGAIDKSLSIGDTVIVTESVCHDLDIGVFGAYRPFVKDGHFHSDKDLIELFRKLKPDEISQRINFGKTATGDIFIGDDGRDKIIALYNPLCVDMETASAAQVCFLNSIPFIAIRSITDTADDSGFDTFETNVKIASQNSFDVFKASLKYIKGQNNERI